MYVCAKDLLKKTILMIFLFSGYIVPYYFYTDFSDVTHVTTNFELNFWYSRNGTHRSAGCNVDVSGGQLTWSGTLSSPSDLDGGGNYGLFYGRAVRFTNRTFDASAENPFGYVIVRSKARFDPHNDSSQNESFRHFIVNSFYLYEDTGITNFAPTFTSYDNFTFMYESMKCDYNENSSGKPFSTWGSFISSEVRFDFSKVVNSSGGFLSLTNDPLYCPEWNYEDYALPGGRGGTGANNNPDNTNTNVIAVMITHDGSQCSYYINPNYNGHDQNVYPNEFLFLSSNFVDWNQNLSFMFGFDTKRPDTEMTYMVLDSILIRSVASGAGYYFEKIEEDEDVYLYCFLMPRFKEHDAGVSRIFVDTRSGVEMTSDRAAVYTCYGKGEMYPTAPYLRRLELTSVCASHSGKAQIRKNGNRITVDFFRGYEGKSPGRSGDTLRHVKHNVIHAGSPSREIILKLKLKKDHSLQFLKKSLMVYLDCPRTAVGSYPRFATTGKMRASYSEISICRGD